MVLYKKNIVTSGNNLKVVNYNLNVFVENIKRKKDLQNTKRKNISDIETFYLIQELQEMKKSMIL